jgi:Na+-transporting methylmalonyl-CoA/oxaloacetate decarboxylase gamma subunit
MWYILFFLFVIICFIVGWYTLGTILLILTVSLIIAIIHSAKKEDKKREDKDKKMKESEAEREAELQNVIIPAYNNARSQLIDKYGNPAKVFVLEQYNLDKEIIAFEESKRIWICGKDFEMKSILSCTFTNDVKVVKGQIISTTKTKSGNMVKRAVVGDVLLGGAGAVIGGSTAKKSTITTQEDDKVYHDYTVVINVDSLSDPIIRVHLGSDGKTLNEIVGLMNVIIQRNRK